uniref:acylphosphatase n=1 Tax=Chrysemys picta bellii TaxID=8478 RepID=A0A8C3IHM6_CHRPI
PPQLSLTSLPPARTVRVSAPSITPSRPSNAHSRPREPRERAPIICFRAGARADSPTPPTVSQPPAALRSSRPGVFFRKYTEDQGKKLGVVGWVKNTPYGTVTGQVQGPKEKIEIMKNWLGNVGSPMSHIDRAVFSNEREISTLEFPNFTTKY